MQTKQLDQYQISVVQLEVLNILETFDKETVIHKQSTQHTTRSSYADEYEMIQDLVECGIMIEENQEAPGQWTGQIDVYSTMMKHHSLCTMVSMVQPVD